MHNLFCASWELAIQAMNSCVTHRQMGDRLQLAYSVNGSNA